MQAEILALRHQLGIYQRTAKRPRIQPADRVFWSRLCYPKTPTVLLRLGLR
jgi:hypothetical protein